jgi:AcrR family transcriptional regulator
MITERKARKRPTRQRLLDAGLKLFARNGFSATTVGAIESEAGLVPRRGALYRHFQGKLALLEAAVSQHSKDVDQATLDLAASTHSDPKQLTITFAKWLLADMDRQRLMTQILEREGGRLAKVRNRFRAGAERGFQATAILLEQWARNRGQELDSRALAVVLMGAVVNFRRSTWTLGKPPLGLTDDEFVGGLSDLIAAIFPRD